VITQKTSFQRFRKHKLGRPEGKKSNSPEKSLQGIDGEAPPIKQHKTWLSVKMRNIISLSQDILLMQQTKEIYNELE
jgi:hypothetical protein